MKALFVADLQLGAGRDLGVGEYGEGSRLHDQAQVLNRIVDLALREKVEVACVLGDVFEYAKPAPQEILLFQGFVRTLRDQGAQVLCIAGNHDYRSAALPSALEIFGEHNIVCALAPTLFPLGAITFAVLPWVPMTRLIAQRSDVPRDELNDLAGQGLAASAELLALRTREEYPDSKAVLLGHWAVSGATLPTGLPTGMLREPVIPLDRLVGCGYDLAVFGHIHQVQAMSSKPPVVYTGSPCVMNWGEAATPHGVWIFDSEAEVLRFEKIEDRDFITLDAVAADLISQPDELEGVAMDEALVRIRYEATEEEARKIDQAAIRRSLLACGAVKVFFKPTIVRAQRARVEEMREDVSDVDALDLWISSQNDSLPDPERLRRLHGEFESRVRA